jgi:hypothetical protein
VEIIAQKIFNQNNSIKEILHNRLAYFSNQGLSSKLDYKAKTATVNELNIHNINFNRVLFNVLAFLLENSAAEENLQVSVSNNSQFLKIKFSFPHGRTGSRPLSLKNGLSLLSPRRKPQTSFLAVQRLVRESGGSFSLISLTSHNPIYCLQIPLCPLPNQDNSSPPPREISTYRFESKGALSEGVFDSNTRKSA